VSFRGPATRSPASRATGCRAEESAFGLRVDRRGSPLRMCGCTVAGHGQAPGDETGHEESESRFLSRAPGSSQGRFRAALLRNDNLEACYKVATPSDGKIRTTPQSRDAPSRLPEDRRAHYRPPRSERGSPFQRISHDHSAPVRSGGPCGACGVRARHRPERPRRRFGSVHGGAFDDHAVRGDGLDGRGAGLHRHQAGALHARAAYHGPAAERRRPADDPAADRRGARDGRALQAAGVRQPGLAAGQHPRPARAALRGDQLRPVGPSRRQHALPPRRGPQARRRHVVSGRHDQGGVRGADGRRRRARGLAEEPVHGGAPRTGRAADGGAVSRGLCAPAATRGRQAAAGGRAGAGPRAAPLPGIARRCAAVGRLSAQRHGWT
jgi:hypothetical protein